MKPPKQTNKQTITKGTGSTTTSLERLIFQLQNAIFLHSHYFWVYIFNSTEEQSGVKSTIVNVVIPG